MKGPCTLGSYYIPGTAGVGLKRGRLGAMQQECLEIGKVK